MKLRIVPLVTAVAVSSVLLFGGWFTYKQFAVQQPLEHLVTKYEGVKNVQFDINQKELDMKLDLAPKTDIRGLAKYVTMDGKDLIGNRKLKMTVEDHSNKALDLWWSKALFSVAEAMDGKKYTEIPDMLNQLVKGQSNMSADATMDDKNIYISLTDGKASKFIILPRVPGELGVWNNV
ncbi:hypothetical protein J2Z69_000602 [Paenibacillus shirakamiensis]|uniref:DUF4352 domain-containing protein n=1 Tax=Paenibacillus shirakamiensis TaxID=1265935 RepID=A0ABS4JD00_9BACL|nr:hypothetical protein [Paenibacillus shirakamiensis]MBP1999583.1 hypothetical protein [Paenibacillus shirakamiensis]